jgi:anti-sigma regulatory factor (Ser/Thr protein kinase)
MATETHDIAACGDEHIVHFYERDSELVSAVAPYLAAAILSDEATIVIATESHRRAFEAALEVDGIDLSAARGEGRFLALDAATTLNAFTTDGQIDHLGFRGVIGGLVRGVAESGRTVRAYGEMVALLWEAGEVPAAIELETLWNELALTQPFSLFCSYPASSVAGSEHAEALHEVCSLHSSVTGQSGDGHRGTADATLVGELAAEFSAERDAPGQARRLVVDALERADHRKRLIQDAALVVSELASNAVLHARSPFSISVRREDPVLRIAVRDACPLADAMPDRGLIVHPGHGLGLIDALATCWGAEGSSDGKVVWAELRI